MKKISFSAIKKMAAGAIIMLAIGAQAQTVEVPFVYDGGKNTLVDGMTATGLGNDYTVDTKMNFNSTGDNLVIHISDQAAAVAFKIKGYNTESGFGTFEVQESEDGSTYTNLDRYRTILSTNAEDKSYNISPNTRYIRFIYTSQGSQTDKKVGLGAIRIYTRQFSIGSLGWITYYTDEEYEMPEGATGYFVTEKSADELTLLATYQEGETVPAETALLIHGAEGTYTYTTPQVLPHTISATNHLHGNLSRGTIAEVPWATKYYKLANGTDGLGWYYGAENGGVFEMGGFKAYLAVGSTGILRLPSFDLAENEATDLKAVEASEKAVKFIRDGQLFIRRGEHLYNATGQEVQ